MLESACQIHGTYVGISMSDRHTDGRTEIEIRASGLSEVTLPKDKYRSAALGLWEGLSHSATLRSIVIVLKCHSTLLRLIVIFFKVVGAKNNWL